MERIKTITNNNTDKLEYTTKYHTGDLNKLNFLVSGGAGFIGSHIVEYLLKYNAAKVRVLDNMITGSWMNIEPYTSNPAFEFIEGDICDINICKQALEGIDFVSHQAAIGSVLRSIEDPVYSNSVNIDGFLNVISTAKEKGVKGFVYASSSSVYGDEHSLPKVEEKTGNPLSPYAVSKYTNELYAGVFAKNYGFSSIGLRYFNVFGPRQDPAGPYAAVIPRFVGHVLSGKEVFIEGDGEQSRDFTFIENAVQMNIRSLLCEDPKALNQVYNVACGKQLTINELYSKISKLLGVEKKAIYKDERPGDIRYSLASIEKAKSLLSYSHIIDFEEGMEKTIDSFSKIYLQ